MEKYITFSALVKKNAITWITCLEKILIVWNVKNAWKKKFKSGNVILLRLKIINWIANVKIARENLPSQ